MQEAFCNLLHSFVLDCGVFVHGITFCVLYVFKHSHLPLIFTCQTLNQQAFQFFVLYPHIFLCGTVDFYFNTKAQMLVKWYICNVHSPQKSDCLIIFGNIYSEEEGNVRGKMRAGLDLGVNEIGNTGLVVLLLADLVCLKFNGNQVGGRSMFAQYVFVFYRGELKLSFLVRPSGWMFTDKAFSQGATVTAFSSPGLILTIITVSRE